MTPQGPYREPPLVPQPSRWRPIVMRFLRLCQLAAVGSASLFIGLWLGASGEPKEFGPLRATVGLFASIVCVAACAGYVSGIDREKP